MEGSFEKLDAGERGPIIASPVCIREMWQSSLSVRSRNICNVQQHSFNRDRGKADSGNDQLAVFASLAVQDRSGNRYTSTSDQ